MIKYLLLMALVFIYSVIIFTDIRKNLASGGGPPGDGGSDGGCGGS